MNLLDDLQRLLDAVEQDVEPVERVAVVTDRHVEVDLRILQVRLGLPRVFRHARRLQDRARDPVALRHLTGKDADADGSLLEDLVPKKQTFIVEQPVPDALHQDL